MRQTYYEDDTGKFEFSIKDKYVFIHSTVHKLTHNILKRHIEVFSSFLNELAKGEDYMVITVTPNPKYAAMMGGKQIGFYSENGKEYEVFQWVLK